MARFILLYAGGTLSKDSTEEQRNEMFAKWGAWVDELDKKGVIADGEPFGFGAKDVSKDGVVDHTEWTQDDINGFNIVNVNSIEEAVEIAKGCPSLPHGGKVLVRDFLDMSGMMPQEEK